MSSANNNNNGQKQQSRKKSVRFDGAVAAAATSSSKSAAAAAAATTNKQDDQGVLLPIIRRPKKRVRPDRSNEDELDDIDEWVPDEDDKILPSEHERLKAKRARRQQRQGEASDSESEKDDDDNLDEQYTSLAQEGIPVEPFHMEQETNDGTGYFDGDTYVFRHQKDPDEEPDAWLDSLKEDATTLAATANANADAADDSSTTSTDDMKALSQETLSKEDYYAKIVPLVSDTETIMQAVVRYGSLLKRKPPRPTKKGHKHNTATTSTDVDGVAMELAQQSLNDLTEAANALLRMGDVDIYQKTRNDLLKLTSSGADGGDDNDNEADAMTDSAPVSAKAQPQITTSTNNGTTICWEYKGSQDGQIHGPYTSEQMRGWIQAGYFVGAQAVQVRKVTTTTLPKDAETNQDKVQDLLSDLMDDDDDDDNDNDNDNDHNEKDNESDNGNSTTNVVRGEWMLSDQVHF